MHPTLFAPKRAYQAARHVLEVELQGAGMTIAQMDALKLVLAAPSTGLDQRALQASLGVTSATLTRLLAGMERKSLIVRSPTRPMPAQDRAADAQGRPPLREAGREP